MSALWSSAGRGLRSRRCRLGSVIRGSFGGWERDSDADRVTGTQRFFTVRSFGVVCSDGRNRVRSRVWTNPVLCQRLSSNGSNNRSSKSSGKIVNLSVCIVGSGPSGCYTAKYLLSAIRQLRHKRNDNDDDDNVNDNWSSGLKRVDVDILDRLATPFGLVRTGVAPDHPEVKNVQNDFAALFTTDDTDTNNDNDTTEPLETTVHFRGNVNVGHDVPLAELRSLYDVVVLAYGCESDRSLPSQAASNLTTGIYSARQFVAWYNAHPDFVHLGQDVARSLSPHPQRADDDNNEDDDDDEEEDGIVEANVVVIGQGNVALDCARVLAKGGHGLRDTDVADHVLPVLRGGVTNTTILGRRGHVQGAFTIKELREFTKLDEEGHRTSFHVSARELDAGTTQASLRELEGPGSRPKVRIDKLLREAAEVSDENDDDPHKKHVRLRFLTQPIRFLPHPSDPTRLGSVLCKRTELTGEPGKQIAVSTGEITEIPADMALISVGYKGIPLPDMDESLFDHDRGIVRNHHGRVVLPTSDFDNGNENDDTTDGLYVCGWLKRGPSGIIGTNIADAKDTVASILDDLTQGAVYPPSTADARHETGRGGLDRFLKRNDIEAVDWGGYLHIDECERREGRRRTEVQPRGKFTSTMEMVALVRERR